MPIEFSYFLFSLLLTAYAMWRYFMRRERGLFYLSLGFTFLTTSIILQLVESLIWIYGSQVNITTLRLLELGGLALFACFAVFVVLALKEISKKPNEYFKHSEL
jgi:hypothetical protein